MLTKKQLSELREHLEKAQNPVFFYDNDADGLCSYVLLRRFLGRGKGVAVKTHPGLDAGYAKKVQELGADYVFVLDRPVLGKEFVEGIKGFGLPLVWIDHHSTEEDADYENIFVFNPMKSKRKKSFEPVTYWCYKLAGREEDVWIAVMGCVADHYLPDFAKEFGKRWPEYWGNPKNLKEPFDAYYGTGIGMLARALAFGLKDSVTHVVYLQNFLINCKNPSEMFLELESNRSFGKKYRELKKKYDNFVNEAKRKSAGKMLFFDYGGDLSISSEISNELSYRFKEQVVVVAYRAGAYCNISLRGKNVRKILEKVIPKFEDSRGGGHEDAVGARIKTEDLERFKNEIAKEIGD